jgi:hypothetical protein
MENNNFDPLDNLLNRQKAALNGETINTDQTPDPSINTNPATGSIENNGKGLMDIDIDDEYGNNDLESSIREEEKMEQLAREKAIAEKRAKMEADKKDAMPPQEYDMKYHTEAIGFQSDKLNIVTGMVNRVVAKYRLISGGIPDTVTNLNGRIIRDRMQVMGELIDLYHTNGETITPEFEKIVLSNWILPDQTLAINNINENGIVVDRTMYNAPTNIDQSQQTNNQQANAESTQTAEPPTININVEKNAPVTVNVDDSVTSMMSQSNVVNIHVKEVSEKDMSAVTIIENSNKPGIIKAYDPGINDVPVTLPLSAYRCTIRSINWSDFIKLSAPTSNNPSDNELKKWSVIYKHIKNPSIGEFTDFEDFLKKTKYQDKELLLWGLLVATSGDEETLNYKCGNKKCRKDISIKYRPREIVQVDATNPVTEKWREAEAATVGPEAIKVWESVNRKRRRYKLPNTGIIAEINDPSAYEFITEKLPLVNKIFKRYRPDQEMFEADQDDPTLTEFDYLSANALYVSAMTIVVNENGTNKEYRYTNWDDIESIITTALDSEDSGILLKIIEKSRSHTSPLSFKVPVPDCPHCGRHEEYIPIDDIGNSLLFQLSRRLNNTQINLIEMDSN